MILDKLVKNEKDLLCDSALITLAETVLEARKKKPSSKLIEMSKCISEIAFYVNDLRMQRDAYHLYMKAKDDKLYETLQELQKLKDEFYDYEDNTIERGNLRED